MIFIDKILQDLGWLYHHVGLPLYVASVLTVVIIILTQNRNPIRSIAWIMAVVFLPVIGLVFYGFFGLSPKGMQMISRANKRKLLHGQPRNKIDLNTCGYTPDECQVVKLAYSLSQAPLTLRNDIDIYIDGRSKFEALKQDLRSAQSSIFLEYYLFDDDILGQELAEILIERAQAGVEVKIIYDHVGSMGAKKKFFRRMKAAGIDVHPFFRVTFRQLANRINWRNHRKMAIIDHSIGYIGGMNIAERYITGMPDGSTWRDTHFRVRGDIVNSLSYRFSIDWNFLKKKPTLDKRRNPDREPKSNIGMQLVTTGPTDIWNNLELCFTKAIASAKRCIYIQTPYFLPTESLLDALRIASFAKVDVRIMIPVRSDSRMLEFASFSYITECLRAGIKVYLYEPGMLHSKVMIIDDSLVTAGSTNFDFRSMENNFEANLLIYDQGVNRRMKDIFFDDIASCRKINKEQWYKRPRLQRMIESIVRIFAPLL